MSFVGYLHNVLKNLFYKEAEMKKFLFSLVCYGFSSDEIKVYPPRHYKGNQHIYQQVACKAFGLCRW